MGKSSLHRKTSAKKSAGLNFGLANTETKQGNISPNDYQILFEFSNTPSLILLPDFTIAAVNNTFLNETFTARVEIVGKSVFGICVTNSENESAANLLASLSFVLNNKTAHSMAVQKHSVKMPNGKIAVRFWSIVNTPVFNVHMEIVYIIFKAEDVTEFISAKNKDATSRTVSIDILSQTEKMETEIFNRAAEIQKINEQLEFKIIEGSAVLKKQFKEITDYKFALDESCIVAITNNKGIIQYVNDKFCQISKYNREELIGNDHRIINSSYHPKPFFRDLWSTISKGKIWRGEIRNKAKDGTYYWVDTTIVPFLEDNKRPYQYVAIRADITKRKEAEFELQNMNFILEKKVAERTAQLEGVNKELESFSYSVSHDLRSPLRAINGYAQMLQEDYGDKLDDEADRIIYSIMNNAKKMGQLIDDLLLFSRTGRKELEKTAVNMNILVSNIIGDIADGRASFEIEELAPAFADKTAMKQVWTNLISNAVKYSSLKANPIIKIGSEKKEDMTVYYIKDNGAGFDMRYANKLFGVFQRLHSENEFEGTGVGLAIVQRIILKHEGNVWAEAIPDKGASFYFTLPIKS